MLWVDQSNNAKPVLPCLQTIASLCTPLGHRSQPIGIRLGEDKIPLLLRGSFLGNKAAA